jgi:hypothetical protein
MWHHDPELWPHHDRSAEDIGRGLEIRRTHRRSQVSSRPPRHNVQEVRGFVEVLGDAELLQPHEDVAERDDPLNEIALSECRHICSETAGKENDWEFRCCVRIIDV